ncbi:MAG TPA: hypothetical protein P5294_07920 [Smithellaceae bacterium]|nr:hypothetical protein [Smithellaceae bacterium]HRS89501.1 hypothetical protein [Smithellaceae bacterium]HRV26450.1 hypothetical protein [Smithellaceae bacterium]
MELIFDENEDWEKRILCSDESCIGTIGIDGKCKECGRVFEGELPADNRIVSSKPVAAAEQKIKAQSSEDDDWEKRILCSDESCIGVIGPDGRCKECGKPLK